jgi:NADPH:quinone reductase-like Zn-dependent oxidoreductase
MKAIVWTKYGSPDGLQLQDVDKPTPKDNEVLIKIYASTVSTADCEMRSFKAFTVFWLPLRIYLGFVRPTRIKILGQELAGEIETVGKDVTRFKVGDQVFAWTGFRLSANAEYTCLPENGMLATKPSNMTFEEATTLPIGGLEALHFLRRGIVLNGQKVLINGAGGSIGTFAVQIARYYGAVVTAVDSTEKLDMLRSIGADQVIDYTREDFTKSGQTYDVIFDIAGKSSFSGSLRSLNQNGYYLLGNPGLLQRFQSKLTPKGNIKIIPYAGRTSIEIAEDLTFLKELIVEGKIKPVIDRIYPLELTAEAHRYVDTGHKKGNVVIIVKQKGKT